MFKEIKGLTERNAAYVELMAKNEGARLDTVNNLPVVPTANLETASGMPVLENENVPLIEGNSQFGQGASEIEPWAVFQNNSEGWQTEEEGEDEDYYIDELECLCSLMVN